MIVAKEEKVNWTEVVQFFLAAGLANTELTEKEAKILMEKIGLAIDDLYLIPHIPGPDGYSGE